MRWRRGRGDLDRGRAARGLQPGAEAGPEGRSSASSDELPARPRHGDGRDELLLIELSLPADASADVAIYAFDGDKVCELPQPVAAKQFWDGKDRNGGVAAVGPFFVVAEIEQQGRKSRIRKKGVLWR